MNNRIGIAIFAICIVAILAFTMYWQFGTSQKAQVIDSQQKIPTQTVEEKRIITAVHQYKNGTHIIAGQADVPTPCDILSQNVSVTGTSPKQATIAFSTKNTGDVCAQVITSARFKMEFTASEDVVVSATWNGLPVQLNLIPAGPNDDLENFDVFIKG